MARSLRRTLVLVPVAMLAAGCVHEADPAALAPREPDVERPVAPSGPIDDAREAAAASIADVESYWARTYPRVYGGPFEPVDGYHAYGPDTAMPPCGDPPPTYEQIADNAFYCPSDDLIAWDEEVLVPDLDARYGPLTIGIVFAHEVAHAVQARAEVTGRPIDLELQADCFAGAWAAAAATDPRSRFTVDDEALDASVAGMISISDEPGTTADDELAHGSGFDRIGAFQEGFVGGAETCARYDRVPRETVDVRVGDGGTAPGDMPLHDSSEGPGLLTVLEVDLDEYFSWVLEDLGVLWRPVGRLALVDPDTDQVICDGRTLAGEDLRGFAAYCADRNAVLLDGDGLVLELEEIGDFAVASQIARLWARAAQAQLGVADGSRAGLQADCLTGAWASSTFPDAPDLTPSSDLRISAGDLDEAISGFLVHRDEAVAASGATVFERADALRTGVLDGHRACAEILPLG